jgi:hypothetical protein
VGAVGAVGPGGSEVPSPPPSTLKPRARELLRISNFLQPGIKERASALDAGGPPLAPRMLFVGSYFLVTGFGDVRSGGGGGAGGGAALGAPLPPRMACGVHPVPTPVDVVGLLASHGGVVLAKLEDLPTEPGGGQVPFTVIAAPSSYRTVKYLAAVASGRPPLHVNWVLDSMDARRPLDTVRCVLGCPHCLLVCVCVCVCVEGPGYAYAHVCGRGWVPATLASPSHVFRSGVGGASLCPGTSCPCPSFVAAR